MGDDEVDTRRFQIVPSLNSFISYKLYIAMTAANNKTHTVKGKEKKTRKKKNTQHTIVNIKKKSIKHTNYELKT